MRSLSEQERQWIRHLNGDGLNDADIAIALKRSRLSVRRHRLSMGLPARRIHTIPTIERKAQAMRKAHRRDLGQTWGNYAEATNVFRAAALGWPGVFLMGACVLQVLLDGPRSTPHIRIEASTLRRDRGWRPVTVSELRAHKTLGALRRSGLIRVAGRDQASEDRRRCHQVYELTEKAMAAHATGRPLGVR